MKKQLKIVIEKTKGDLSTRMHGKTGEVIHALISAIAQIFLHYQKSESSAEEFAADVAEYLVLVIKEEIENAEDEEYPISPWTVCRLLAAPSRRCAGRDAPPTAYANTASISQFTLRRNNHGN